jgi:hypothetical protein
VNPLLLRQRLLVCALLCACVGACAGAGRLGATAPAGVNLAGSWKLDHGASDDPEKIYDKIRRQRAARYEEEVPAPQRQRGQGAGGADANSALSVEAQTAAIIATSHLDPFDMGVFGTIPRADVITIRQSADEIHISDGITNRSFTAGARSVVSVPEGVADQHSGWKGHAYVIDVKAQAGPETVERYQLSDDGQHLIADIRSTGGNMPSIKIKRVYDRVNGAPNVAPTND